MRHVALASAFALFAAGCSSNLRTATVFTGRHPRSDAVLREAVRDLACPMEALRIVAETSRRTVNESAFRFVVEGCGARASYVEECDFVETIEPGWTLIEPGFASRDVLFTKLSITPPPPPPRAQAP